MYISLVAMVMYRPEKGLCRKTQRTLIFRTFVKTFVEPWHGGLPTPIPYIYDGI